MSINRVTEDVFFGVQNVFRQLFGRSSRRNNQTRSGTHCDECRCRRHHYCHNLPRLSLAQFERLKNIRDQVCEDMTDYSEVLRKIKKHKAEHLSAYLNSEIQLLVGELKLHTIETTILEDIDWDYHRVFLKASIRLSDFCFSLGNESGLLTATKCYVLVLQHNLEIKTSKAVLPDQELLLFENERFEFEINNLFEIKCQIYSMKYPEHSRFPSLPSLNWRYKAPQFETLFYDDPTRKEPMAEIISKSSFKLCGEVKIDLANHKRTEWKLERPEKSRLEQNGYFVCELVNPDVTTWEGFFANDHVISEVIDEL